MTLEAFGDGSFVRNQAIRGANNNEWLLPVYFARDGIGATNKQRNSQYSALARRYDDSAHWQLFNMSSPGQALVQPTVVCGIWPLCAQHAPEPLKPDRAGRKVARHAAFISNPQVPIGIVPQCLAGMGVVAPTELDSPHNTPTSYPNPDPHLSPIVGSVINTCGPSFILVNPPS